MRSLVTKFTIMKLFCVVFLVLDGTFATKCNRWKLEHSGCSLPPGTTPPCANVTLVYHSEHRSAPPYGLRFAYDTGGRTISTIFDTDLNYCAMQCLIEPNCRGFAFIAKDATLASAESPPKQGTCRTVNDTQTVGTRLETWSYTLIRKSN